jgi:hypothetical protein
MQYNFPSKDKYEFMQIYNLLPDYKRVQTLENFDSIATKILTLKQEIAFEQEIMF